MARVSGYVLVACVLMCAYGHEGALDHTEDITLLETNSDEQMEKGGNYFKKLLDNAVEDFQDGKAAIERLQQSCGGLGAAKKYKFLSPEYNACFANWMMKELDALDQV